MEQLKEQAFAFNTNIAIQTGLLASVMAGLYIASLYNYLLFHSLAEGFSIAIACGLFMLAWISRGFMDNNYLLFMGIAYLFIAGLDMIHTFAYKGMNMFPDYDANLPTQFWIAARYLESLSLLIATVFIKRKLNINLAFAMYTVIFGILIILIFGRIFPDCYIEGAGLTWFKIISEYAISLILSVSFISLYQKRSYFDPGVVRQVFVSIILTICSELAFTFYISVYGLSNLTGHCFKLLSFYLIYKAIIETGLKQPYNLLFLNLNENQKLLEKSKDAAESANRAKSAFLANMSHELRTPLNSVIGYAQILKRDRNATEFQQAGLDVIERSGNHLLHLIDDILDLSKIEARKMELHESVFRLHEFLEGICAMIQIRTHQKGLQFHAEIANELPQIVRADELRLTQILLNLLVNAIKYTDRGRVIFKVSTQNTELPTPKIRFRVTDTGIGIPEEQLNDIFSPFKQVGDHARMTEGTGLGLAISRKLALMMGSDLHVSSDEGKGSTFTFDIKLSQASDIPDHQKADATTPHHKDIAGYKGRKRKILVVDDKKDIRAVLASLLQPLGFEIIEAADGREGLNKASEYEPDMVLMDLIMPVMNGFESVRNIKSLPQLKSIKIIVVSASTPSEPHEIISSTGCDDFIAKPVQFTELFNKLAYHLGLEWMYAADSEPESGTPDGTVKKEADFVIPPFAEAKTLYNLGMSGNVVELRKELDRIAQADERYVPFVQELRELARTFRAAGIREFLGKHFSRY